MEELVNDPDFKPREGRTKKEAAIAICMNSILGSKKSKKTMSSKPIVNINFYGNHWDASSDDEEENLTRKQIDLSSSSTQKGGEKENMGKSVDDKKMAKQEDGEEKKDVKDVEKGKLTAEERNKLPDSKFAYIDSKGGRHLPIHDEAHVRNAMARWNQTQFESKEKKKEAARKIIAAAKRMGIEVNPDSEIARYAGEGKKAADIEQVAETSRLLKSTIEKIDALIEKLSKREERSSKKVDTTPSEGATPDKEGKAPKEDVAKASEEEAFKEGASPEGADLAKAVNKISDSLTKMTDHLAQIDEKFDSLEKRLEKLEKQPVPSKVASPVAVSKGEIADALSADDQKRLAEINKELRKLEDMKENQLELYQQNNMWKKAMALLDERDRILAKSRATI